MRQKGIIKTMKKFDADYAMLKDMYEDEYFPDFLVDKVKARMQDVIDLLETGEKIQK